MVIKEKDNNSLLNRILVFMGIRKQNSTYELRAISKKMKKSGFYFYNLRNDKVTKECGYLIYSIYETIAPLQKFFSEYTKYDNIEKEIIYFFMNKRQKTLVNEFNQEEILKKIGSIKLNDIIKEKKDLFSQFTHDFSNEVNILTDNLYNDFNLLRQLCIFDYFFLLKNFNKDLIEYKFDSKVKFQSAKGKIVSELIIDLFTEILNAIDIINIDNTIEFINQLMNMQIIEKGKVNILFEKLKNLNNKHVLINTIRLLNNGESGKQNSNENKSDIVKNYVTNIYNDMKNTFDVIIMDNKRKYLQQLVIQIFGPEQTYRLDFYNEEESNKFKECNAGEFLWYEPLGYLQTYIEIYMKNKLQSFIETLTIKGRCITQGCTAIISEEVHSLQEIGLRIKAIDKKLDKKFPSGYKLQNYYDQIRTNTNALKYLQEEIDTINYDTGKIIRDALPHIHIIEGELKKFEVDHDKSKQMFIENWNEIDKYLQEPSLTIIQNFLTSIKKFEQLMESYDVIHS